MKRSLLTLFAVAALLACYQPAHATIRQVGPGKTFATPCAAIAASVAGDTIEVDTSVTYVGDVCAWTTNNLTIRGVGGGRAHIDAGGQNSQGKGIWVISGTNTTVENIEFSGAHVIDQNGVGIRQQGDNLTVRNCYFHDNDEGILTDASPTSTITIEFSEFAFNGFGDGQSHNVYIGNIAKLIFRYNYSHHAKIGHLLKTRAAQNFVLYNRLSDEATGTSSYQIDIPNGGLSYVIGNVIEQGPLNDNSTFIAYLEEGTNPGNPSEQLFVINNTFANDAASGTFISPAAGAAPVVIKNNIFFGPGTVTGQTTAIKANNFVGDASFVNAAGYDYHLLSGSPAINAGVDPGLDGTFSLSPVFQYVHPACAEGRSLAGTIDIGAFEFGGGTGIAPPGGTCSSATGPLVSLSASSLTFNAQQLNTTSVAKSFDISNGGNAALTISGITASGDFSQTNNCTTLNPGASCTVNVKFTPTATGTRSGSVTITDTAPGSPHSVSLSGTGTTAATPDFAVSFTPTSATITAGQSAIFSMTVSAAGGFNQSVALTCSGAPAGSACNISPTSINPNGGTATAQVTVSSTARPAALMPIYPRWPTVFIVLLILATMVVLMAYQSARKSSPRTRLAVALPAFAVLLFSLGCGSTGNNTVSNSQGGGTPAGSYNLTINASGGGQSHSSTITVVVK
jgi:HYDIN/CFA65/VesB family protein